MWRISVDYLATPDIEGTSRSRTTSSLLTAIQLGAAKWKLCCWTESGIWFPENIFDWMKHLNHSIIDAANKKLDGFEDAYSKHIALSLNEFHSRKWTWSTRYQKIRLPHETSSKINLQENQKWDKKQHRWISRTFSSLKLRQLLKLSSDSKVWLKSVHDKESTHLT